MVFLLVVTGVHTAVVLVLSRLMRITEVNEVVSLVMRRLPTRSRAR